MLAQLTARKFGQGAANRLDAFLAGVDDLERLVEIGSLEQGREQGLAVAAGNSNGRCLRSS